MNIDYVLKQLNATHRHILEGRTLDEKGNTTKGGGIRVEIVDQATEKIILGSAVGETFAPTLEAAVKVAAEKAGVAEGPDAPDARVTALEKKLADVTERLDAKDAPALPPPEQPDSDGDETPPAADPSAPTEPKSASTGRFVRQQKPKLAISPTHS